MEMGPSVFETVMLVCFGCSWPFAIAKTISSKTVEGKSIVFTVLIFIGYLAGIFFKMTGHFDGVIWLYLINGSLVFTEIMLYFKYRSSTTQFKHRTLSQTWQPLSSTTMLMD